MFTLTLHSRGGYAEVLKGKSGVKGIWDMFSMITSLNVHWGAKNGNRRILELAVISRFYQNPLRWHAKGIAHVKKEITILNHLEG